MCGSRGAFCALSFSPVRLRPAVCPPGALCLASSAGDGAGTAAVWPLRQRLSVGPARPSKEQLRPPAFVRSASLWPGSFVPVIASGERFALSCLPLRCALPAPVPSAVEPSCLAALLPREPSCFAWRPPGRAGGLAGPTGLVGLRSTAASRSLPLLRLTCGSLRLSGELLAAAAVRPVVPAPLRSPARRAGRLWLVRFSPERPSLAVRLRGGSLFRFLRPSAPALLRSRPGRGGLFRCVFGAARRVCCARARFAPPSGVHSHAVAFALRQASGHTALLRQ